MALIFDLHSEDNLSNCRKFKLLKAAVRQKYIEYELNLFKEDYIHCGFEEVELEIAQEKKQYLPNNIQSTQKIWLETSFHNHSLCILRRYTSKYCNWNLTEQWKLQDLGQRTNASNF